MAKYSSSDVQAIADAMRRGKREGRSLFALLLGAGCSISANIPDAKTLIAKINEEFSTYLDGLSEPERSNYGRCMGCLSEAEQRTLIAPYLEGAKVNWAHIAIAGLMKAGYVDRVLTFNFDNVLARACGLAGLYPPIYDFAAAPSNTTSHIASRAIVHLHGQGHGVSMFNSEEKTRKHAERLRPLLEDTFDLFPVLVAGYSGESDAVFGELEKIYKGTQRLYWAGYSEDQPKHLKSLMQSGGQSARFLGGADADQFFMDLANELKCMPTLFDDPYQHLLDELKDVSKFPVKDENRLDVLSQLRKELRQAQKSLLERTPPVANLFRKGDYDAVLEHANLEIPEEREFAYWASINQGNLKSEQAVSDKNAARYQEAIEKYRRAVEINSNGYEAHYNWGSTLVDLARLKDRAALYEEAIEKYRRAIEINPNESRAFSNWGTALAGLFGLTGERELLMKAKEVAIRAQELGGKADYNLACVMALQGDAEVEQQLENCARDGTLSDFKYLEIDSDLHSLRELDWFKQFMERQREKSN